MQIKRLIAVACLVLMGGVIASCTSPVITESPLPTVAVSPVIPTEVPTFSSTTGAITGHIQLPSSWDNDVKVFFAPFYPDQTGRNGFYLLEPSIHRSVNIRPDGFFQASDVKPGKYVIVVGPSAEEARAIEDNGQPRVFSIEAGKLLDIGDLSLLSQ